MNLIAIIGLRGPELIFGFAIVLVLLGARQLPDMCKKVADGNLSDAVAQLGRLLLAVVIVLLAWICLAAVIHHTAG